MFVSDAEHLGVLPFSLDSDPQAGFGFSWFPFKQAKMGTLSLKTRPHFPRS